MQSQAEGNPSTKGGVQYTNPPQTVELLKIVSIW